MSLFERFTTSKEEGFRNEFIKPLLIRMGFYGITNKHGSQEFGKDFVFSEIGPFGSFRHMVVQAKHEERIRQGTMVDQLVSQIKQCFDTPYTVAFAPNDERHVSAVFVFNTGEITENAKEQMINQLPSCVVSNVFVFGGHQLEAIEQTGMYRRLEEIRRSVASLRGQLGFNVERWKGLVATLRSSNEMQGRWEFGRSFLNGLEFHLSNPILPEVIRLSDIGAIWSQAQILDQLVAKHALSYLPFPAETVERDVEAIVNLIDTHLIPRAEQLAETIDQWILSLPDVTR